MVMSGKLTESLQHPSGRYNRRFVQPFAVALVFLLFALLFFGMAMMDLRRLEGVLLDTLKKKALYVAEVVEKSSLDKYRRLMRHGDEYRSLYTGAGIDEEAFSLQETLAGALLDVARTIDSQDVIREPHATEILRDLAESGSFLAIAVLDEAGQIAYQSHPFPAALMIHAKPLLEGREEIAVHLFQAMAGKDATGFMGIRRQTGEGAIVLFLDRQGLDHWAWRTAVRAAMAELQWGAGIVYLAVEDAKGRPLARAGSAPEEKMEECLLTASNVRDPGNPVGRCVRVGDTEFLELSFPFQAEGKTIGTTRVGIETHETDQILVENQRHILLWTGLMVTIGLFAMGVLYQSQNRHVARLQVMQERLHHAERLSSLGKLGAAVAHEIRNPLNAISMATQRIQRDFAPEADDKKERFNRITHIVRDEIKRLNGIVEDFLGLSRSNRMDFRQQSMVDLLERVVFLVRDEAQARGVHIEKRWADPPLLVSMDASKMQQAILNLVRNAVESVTTGEGRVTITCERGPKDLVSIKIRDTGAGIPAGEENRIFDPFFTTKEKGVGLGLAIAHEIILGHGGEIRVESEDGRGTVVQVLLPGKSPLRPTAKIGGR